MDHGLKFELKALSIKHWLKCVEHRTGCFRIDMVLHQSVLKTMF